jgi:glyoxylase-like metal-dependent hydrolase (beta-lactamase superfamily II)
MRVLAWRVPPYDNGMYVIHDERREALLVDPCMGEREAIEGIRESGLRLVEILNTHGHPDHILGNAAVKEGTRARLAIHRLDAYRLGSKRPPTTFQIPPCEPDDLFDEGPLRYVADLEVVALHTPGHTEGSTCFYLEREGVLFAGDVLFKGSTGRWDLPGGDREEMERSLERLATLPSGTLVYPGHGDTTTVGDELPNLRDMHDAGILPGLRV